MVATHSVPVHPSNAGQLEAWDAHEGVYWAENADYFDRSLAGYHAGLLADAAIDATDHVLDIGCGTGLTTREAARLAVDGAALGVDLSAPMLEVARQRAAAEGLANVAFTQADAEIHPFEPASFDVAISRTGTMFFGDMAEAFANLGRALRRGGRLVQLTWQPLGANEWIRELSGAMAAGRDLPTPPSDAPGPFSLSDPDRVRSLLEGAGFEDVELRATTADMWFGTGTDDAHRAVIGVLGWMLDGLDDDGRARALDQLRATVAAHETDQGVLFGSAAWTIRATRP